MQRYWSLKQVVYTVTAPIYRAVLYFLCKICKLFVEADIRSAG
jgi:hypothetical protein